MQTRKELPIAPFSCGKIDKAQVLKQRGSHMLSSFTPSSPPVSGIAYAPASIDVVPAPKDPYQRSSWGVKLRVRPHRPPIYWTLSFSPVQSDHSLPASFRNNQPVPQPRYVAGPTVQGRIPPKETCPFEDGYIFSQTAVGYRSRGPGALWNFDLSLPGEYRLMCKSGDNQEVFRIFEVSKPQPSTPSTVISRSESHPL